MNETKVYSLLHDCKLIGSYSTFASLFHHQDSDFPEYSDHVSRVRQLKKEGILKIEDIKGKQYTVRYGLLIRKPTNRDPNASKSVKTPTKRGK